MRKHLLAFAVIMVMLLTACTPAADPVELSISGIGSRDYFYNTYASGKKVENFPKDMITWDAVAKLGFKVEDYMGNGNKKNLAYSYVLEVLETKDTTIHLNLKGIHDPSVDDYSQILNDPNYVKVVETVSEYADSMFSVEPFVGNYTIKIVRGDVTYQYLPSGKLNAVTIQDGKKNIRVSFSSSGLSGDILDYFEQNHVLVRLFSLSEDEATAAAKELRKVLNSEPLSKTLNKN